jgi:hypothetical protein
MKTCESTRRSRQRIGILWQGHVKDIMSCGLEVHKVSTLGNRSLQLPSGYYGTVKSMLRTTLWEEHTRQCSIPTAVRICSLIQSKLLMLVCLSLLPLWPDITIVTTLTEYHRSKCNLCLGLVAKRSNGSMHWQPDSKFKGHSIQTLALCWSGRNRT